MRRRPNPYRVLAHAVDVGDLRLVELLALHLSPRGSGHPWPSAPAEAAIERLMTLLSLSRGDG